MAEKSNNEWYTPAKYIEAAREVMNGIDLDPASCELANQTVKATRYYSKEDDGLSKEWYGRVWLNPPYGKNHTLPNEYRSTIRQWVTKLISEYQVSNVLQAILLITTQMNAIWFQPLWQYPICFPDHNIRFRLQQSTSYRPGRLTDAHTYGSAFIYLGPNEHKFVNTFSQFGRIARAIDTPRRVEKPIPLWDVERIYA